MMGFEKFSGEKFLELQNDISYGAKFGTNLKGLTIVVTVSP